jgi:hypothetical protein
MPVAGQEQILLDKKKKALQHGLGSSVLFLTTQSWVQILPVMV